MSRTLSIFSMILGLALFALAASASAQPAHVVNTSHSLANLTIYDVDMVPASSTSFAVLADVNTTQQTCTLRAIGQLIPIGPTFYSPNCTLGISTSACYDFSGATIIREECFLDQYSHFFFATRAGSGCARSGRIGTGTHTIAPFGLNAGFPSYCFR